jgi:glycosyltransferase involved in cell wall biosynthesis
MTNSLETGGSERQFATLAAALKPEHLQVRLGCLRRIGAFAERLEEIVEFPPGGSLFKLPAQRARLDLARYLRANRVVIAHSFDFYSNLMMIPSARLARVPIVVGSQRQLGDLLSFFRNGAQHAVLRWCDRVVCNSQAAAARLHKARIRPEKLVVIPNALPSKAFAAATPALPVISSGVRVVMIARMNDPAKRHDIFLQAAGRLAAKHLKLEFILVGDGPLRPGLEAMAAKLSLREQVIFLGERHDIPAVLAASDISVLPSMSESLSNSIMESMAAGVPVVACRAGGNDELIRDGENGFLVPTADAEALAERIDTLVQQPELRKSLGVTARQDARRFSVERVCGEYERLYASLLQEKGIGRRDLVLSGAGRT